ncbi:MAG: peptidoglycan DD-metalloendopeptidase family protein [Acidimicrobiia bacterium]|nr:peptidoglycan DD-metalloendopeptidase family protein [Acidimicrobiia bacterium]
MALVLGLVTLTLSTSAPASASIGDEMAAVQSQADALTLQMSNLQTELALLEREIADLETEADEIRAEIALLEDEVREVAVNRYVNAGNQPSIWTPDPLETARLDTLMGAAQDRSNATMATFRDAGERLERSTSSLDDRMDAQQEAQDELSDSLAELQEELQRLAELRRQAELEDARRSAEQAASAARAAATTSTTGRPSIAAAATSPSPVVTSPPATQPSATQPPATTPSPPPTTVTELPAAPPSSPGSFVCPVTPSSFVDSYGAPRSGGRSHKGVDMMAPIGTPAVAPVSGRVEHRGNTTGGLSYHLHGDDGNYYYGTHLSAYGASGQVAAGTVIGYVGDTGNAAGIPHLHFEIHRGGRGNSINPYATVRASC